MIKLTTNDGRPMWITAEDVKTIHVVGEEFLTSVNGYHVKESPAEVARKVLEYKIEMAKFRTGFITIAGLNRLAGLEESQ